MLYSGLGACHLLPSRVGLSLWDQGKVPEPGTPGEGKGGFTENSTASPCSDEGRRDRVGLGISPISLLGLASPILGCMTDL